jgi:translation elongation factor P/translation initiation factor 5A
LLKVRISINNLNTGNMETLEKDVKSKMKEINPEKREGHVATAAGRTNCQNTL